MAFAGLQNAVAAFGTIKTAKNEIDVPTAYGMTNSTEMAAYINSKKTLNLNHTFAQPGFTQLKKTMLRTYFRLLKFEWK